MKHSAPTALLLLLALSSLAAADDVYLTNGEVFEGVVAEVTESQVRIELPFGTMSLPRSRLARIERGTTPLQEYQKRWDELQAAGGPGRDWLALARWARVNDLARGYREAAMIAAEIEPELEGLGPIMRGLGFAMDPELGQWIDHDEVMRRQGLVRHEGDWLLPEEKARRIAAHQRAQAAERRGEREEPRGPSDNEVTMAQIELLRDVVDAVKERQPEPRPSYPYTYPYPYPGYVLGVGFLVTDPHVKGGIHSHASSGGTLAFQATEGASPWDSFQRRQPGSFLPLEREH